MSWTQWMEIIFEAREEVAATQNERPVACPNDGEPLVSAPNGALFCPFDGWTE